MRRSVSLFLFLACAAACSPAQSLRGTCTVSANADSAELSLEGNCHAGGRDCDNHSDSGVPWSRLAGVSAGALLREGAPLDAGMTGEAGELRCTGAVHDGKLQGSYVFTPDAAFRDRLSAMGVGPLTPGEQGAYLMLDITSAWVSQMKKAGVAGVDAGNTIALRALHVDEDYVRGMAQAGYPSLTASKLTEMKAVGVSPKFAKEMQDLGLQPSEQDLVQMSVFHIDRAFIERMRAKGMKDVTVAKLVQVKIFKLDQ